MAVHDIGTPVPVGAARQRRRDPAEEREAAKVVGPIAAARIGIGAAGAIIERRLVDEVGEPAAAGKPGECHADALGGERRVQPDGIGDAGKGVEKPRVSRQQQPDIGALGRERRRQRRRDIAEPARFDPRIELGGDVEDAHRRRA